MLFEKNIHILFQNTGHYHHVCSYCGVPVIFQHIHFPGICIHMYLFNIICKTLNISSEIYNGHIILINAFIHIPDELTLILMVCGKNGDSLSQ